MLELTVCVTLLKDLIMTQSMLLVDNGTRRLANGISQHKIVISEELKEQYLNLKVYFLLLSVYLLL